MAENTNTILNFTELQNVSLSDILYVIHGTGLDRDRYATLENVAKALALNGYAIAFEQPTFMLDEDDNHYKATINVGEKKASLFVVFVQTGSHDVYLDLQNVTSDNVAKNIVIVNNGSTGTSINRHKVYLKWASSYSDFGNNSVTWCYKYGIVGGVAFGKSVMVGFDEDFKARKFTAYNPANSKHTIVDENGIDTNGSLQASIGSINDLDVQNNLQIGASNTQSAFSINYGANETNINRFSLYDGTSSVNSYTTNDYDDEKNGGKKSGTYFVSNYQQGAGYGGVTQFTLNATDNGSDSRNGERICVVNDGIANVSIKNDNDDVIASIKPKTAMDFICHGSFYPLNQSNA